MNRTKTSYQFRDPATGLFWTGNLKPARGTMFNEEGTEVRSEASANSLWRQYEAMRRLTPNPKFYLPDLERVEYHVRYETTKVENYRKDDRYLIPVLFQRVSPHSGAVRFARQLVDRVDWQDFPYMVETVEGGQKSRLDDLIEALNNPVVSSRKTSHRLIAVRSETEMLFCKMQLGSQYKCAWELATARRII